MPVDPDVPVAAGLPAALLERVARTLALPVTPAPCPAVPFAHPATLDEDLARPDLDDDLLRRRRLFFDFDRDDRLRDVALGPHHATTGGGHERGQDKTTECVLKLHVRSS